jgi:hypothetical protein
MRELGVILAVGGAAKTFALFDENDFPAEFSRTERLPIPQVRRR